MLSELKLLLASDDKLINAIKYLNPRKPKNVRMKRIGSSNDGGYIMIDDFITHHGNSYSFGVGRNTSWERHISKDYNNKIYMYDHTVNGHNSSDKNFIFKKIGIGRTNNNNLKTIQQIIKDNNHVEDKNLTLQCDIEGAEWDIFLDTSQDTLQQFTQMNIEFHWIGEMLTNDVSQPDGYEKVIKTFEVLRKNFTPFHIHGNNHSRALLIDNKVCPEVVEVSYIRNDLVDFTDEDVIFPTALDRPNNIRAEDIKLGNFKW